MQVYVIEIILYMPFKCQSVFFSDYDGNLSFKKFEEVVENRQKSKAENENHI